MSELDVRNTPGPPLGVRLRYRDRVYVVPMDVEEDVYTGDNPWEEEPSVYATPGGHPAWTVDVDDVAEAAEHLNWPGEPTPRELADYVTFHSIDGESSSGEYLMGEALWSSPPIPASSKILWELVEMSKAKAGPGTAGPSASDIETVNRHRELIGAGPLDLSAGWSAEEIAEMAENIRTKGRTHNPKLKRKLMR